MKTHMIHRNSEFRAYALIRQISDLVQSIDTVFINPVCENTFNLIWFWIPFIF